FIARTRLMTRLQRASRSLATVGGVVLLVVAVLAIGPMLSADRATGPTSSTRASDEASGSALPPSPRPLPSAAGPARLTLTTATIEWCGSIGGCATYATLIRDDDIGAREIPVPNLPFEGEEEHESVLPPVIGPGSYVARFRLAAVSDAQAVGSPRDETTLWTCESSFEVTNESAVHIAASFLRDWCDVTTTYEPAAPEVPVPRVVCSYPKRPTTLTCGSAIEAAMTALPGDADVVSIEFRHSDAACPPRARCAAVDPNSGYVSFDLADGSADFAVSVLADENGVVTAGLPEPLELPSPAPTPGLEPDEPFPADAGPQRTVDALIDDAMELDGERVHVAGVAIIENGSGRLCASALESYPPGCGAPFVELLGVIPDAVRDQLVAPTLRCGLRPICIEPTTRWGEVEIVGTFRNDNPAHPALEIEAIRVIGR
ncbi:MAG TPA: hypothetical protein VK867_06550, partial [Candidatus Limnocylindrales bacterium]|nr:hypothetical protein [Candidatus Limnocylindrales bacterium]